MSTDDHATSSRARKRSISGLRSVTGTNDRSQVLQRRAATSFRLLRSQALELDHIRGCATTIAAVVQAEAAWFDNRGGVDKAAATAEVARHGALLVAIPETVMPGYLHCVGSPKAPDGTLQ
jgi:hypothetical protein